MMSQHNPDFDLIGGDEAVHRLVEAFYRNMDSRAEARTIRAMHAQDLGPTKAILKLYLSEWLGGPAEYSMRRGHPRLRRRHGHLAIGPAERDAWLGCMKAALDEAAPRPDPQGKIEGRFRETCRLASQRFGE